MTTIVTVSRTKRKEEEVYIFFSQVMLRPFAEVPTERAERERLKVAEEIWNCFCVTAIGAIVDRLKRLDRKNMPTDDLLLVIKPAGQYLLDASPETAFTEETEKVAEVLNNFLPVSAMETVLGFLAEKFEKSKKGYPNAA